MSLLVTCGSVSGYPVESKPLNNNPDSWNFGAENLNWEPNKENDPSASALISESHVKKSKITPKSIFIAPSSNSGLVCPNGFRTDDNGKCIKIVIIDQGKYQSIFL